ncbi:MAG: hypothetical protein IID43_02000 [Planctomycetes bacterium]|nr:hypothetical protein [Planctomycetota bacterium]
MRLGIEVLDHRSGRRCNNWNVTSTVSFITDVLDRVHPSPYGELLFDAYTINGDYDGDGDIDASDDSNFTTCKNGSQPLTGACRVFDFDNDGDVHAGDRTGRPARSAYWERSTRPPAAPPRCCLRPSPQGKRGAERG